MLIGHHSLVKAKEKKEKKEEKSAPTKKRKGKIDKSMISGPVRFFPLSRSLLSCSPPALSR